MLIPLSRRISKLTTWLNINETSPKQGVNTQTSPINAYTPTLKTIESNSMFWQTVSLRLGIGQWMLDVWVFHYPTI